MDETQAVIWDRLVAADKSYTRGNLGEYECGALEALLYLYAELYCDGNAAEVYRLLEEHRG